MTRADTDVVTGANAHTAASPDAQSPDRDEVAGRLAIAIGRINRRLRSSDDGLSHGLLSALSTVVRKGPLRPGDLARIEVVAAPTMTRAIADLESRGLLVRSPDPDDGRSFQLEATDAGRDAVLRARSQRAERVQVLLAGLDDDDIALIASALAALEATAIAPAPARIRPSASADSRDS